MRLPPDLERACIALDPAKAGTIAKRTRDKPELVAASFAPPGTWIVPLAVSNPLNQGKVNRAAFGRSNHERWAVRKAIGPTLAPIIAARLRIDRGEAVAVVMTRLGGRKMDDDAIPAAMKYVRDAIAYLVGIDDGHPLWRWRYGQQPSGPCGVRVDVRANGGGAG